MLTIQSLCGKAILLSSGKVSLEGDSAVVVNKYLESGREQRGEVCWDYPEAAPGNERVRLKAVRIVSENKVTGEVDISKEFCIEVDYWNLQANGRRMISIHIYNSKGICILTSANLPSVSLVPDSWYSRPYPVGIFRTSCIIPGGLLNDGLHSVSAYINGEFMNDNIFSAPDVISFNVRETGVMREEYTGEWWGAVRVRLGWQTTQLS